MSAVLERGTILDASGTPIPLAVVPEPEAETLLRPDGVDYDVADRYRGYPSKNLTPRKIEGILEAADAGEPYEWVELMEEMLEKDPKIQSVAVTRRKAVLGINHEIRPVKLDDENSGDQALADEIAKFCNAALQRAGLRGLVGHLMDSVGKGIAVDWVDWVRDKDKKWVPARFRKIPTKHLRWGNDSDSIRVWQPNSLSSTSVTSDGQIGEKLTAYTTVRALDEEREDHPTRGGLLRTCVWYYLFKNTSIKDWVSSADRYGIPSRILTLSDSDFKNPAMYDRARAALRSIGSNLSGVISDKWRLDLAAALAKGGADLFNTILDYIDRAIAQLWLGHELSSQGSKGGGNLGISAAIQVRQDYLEGDCNSVSGIIRRDLLVPMTGWNYGWDKLHLVPNSIFDFEPPKDIVAESNVLSTNARTFPTMTFSIQQIRDQYGYDEPVDDDDTITAGDGAAAGGDPITAPDVPVGTPDGATVNSVLAKRRGALLPKSSPTARQKKVDRLTTKAVSAAITETSKWQAQLRTMIREGVKDGLTVQQMVHRVSKAYPDLDVDRLETQLQESLVLVRLFGRNA